MLETKVRTSIAIFMEGKEVNDLNRIILEKGKNILVKEKFFLKFGKNFEVERNYHPTSSFDISLKIKESYIIKGKEESEKRKNKEVNLVISSENKEDLFSIYNFVNFFLFKKSEGEEIFKINLNFDRYMQYFLYSNSPEISFKIEKAKSKNFLLSSKKQAKDLEFLSKKLFSIVNNVNNYSTEEIKNHVFKELVSEIHRRNKKEFFDINEAAFKFIFSKYYFLLVRENKFELLENVPPENFNLNYPSKNKYADFIFDTYKNYDEKEWNIGKNDICDYEEKYSDFLLKTEKIINEKINEENGSVKEIVSLLIFFLLTFGLFLSRKRKNNINKNKKK
jgi:hypothetical protein